MKISIILASYNYAQYIQEAIESVIAQSYPDWELIIVDDGSSDNSVEIIKFYCEKDDRIKLFQHQNCANKGLIQTILLGLEHSKGEWVAFLESDDVFNQNNLSQKIKIIEEGKRERRQEVKLIFNKVNFLWESDVRKKEKAKKFEKIQKKLSAMKFPKNMFYDLSSNNLLLTFSAVMVKKDVLLSSDFNSPYDSSLDWWLWILIALKNDFYYVDEPLTNWRIHDGSYIKTDKKRDFWPIQALAYFNVFKKSPNIRLLFFIVRSLIRQLYNKIYRLFKR